MCKNDRFIHNILRVIEHTFPAKAWDPGPLSDPTSMDYMLEEDEIAARAIHKRVLRDGMVNVAYELTDQECTTYLYNIGECCTSLYPQVFLDGIGLYLCLVVRCGSHNAETWDMGFVAIVMEKIGKIPGPGISKSRWSPLQINLLMLIWIARDLWGYESSLYPDDLTEATQKMLIQFPEAQAIFEPLVETIVALYAEDRSATQTDESMKK